MLAPVELAILETIDAHLVQQTLGKGEGTVAAFAREVWIAKILGVQTAAELQGAGIEAISQLVDTN